MTPAPAPLLGSPGIDRFTPEQLLRTAQLFASDPDLPDLVGAECGQRRWVELDSSPYLQIWLLSLPAGTHTGWHDHGESAGAYLSVSGTLLEQTSHDHDYLESTLVAGDGRTFGPNHVHQVTNVGLETALSVHLYTPRLTTMTRYAERPARLRPGGVAPVGLT